MILAQTIMATGCDSNNNTGFYLGLNTPIMKFTTLSIPLLGPCISLGTDGVHWAHIRKHQFHGNITPGSVR